MSKKLTLREKELYIVEVMKSNLSNMEKAEKLAIFDGDYETTCFPKVQLHKLYIALLDQLGVQKYTGDDEEIKHYAKTFC